MRIQNPCFYMLHRQLLWLDLCKGQSFQCWRHGECKQICFWKSVASRNHHQNHWSILRCNSQMIVSCNRSRSAWDTFKWSHKKMHRLFMSQDNYLPFDKIYSLWYPQVRGLPLWGPHIQMSSHSSLSSPTIQICHPAEVFHWSMGQQLTRILVPRSHSQLHKILSISLWSLFSYLIMLATIINEQSSLVSLFISKFFVQVKNSK